MHESQICSHTLLVVGISLLGRVAAVEFFFPLQYEDALESPLEQCISDSMLRSKDTGNLFSLVPSGVPSYKTSQTISEDTDSLQPISSPDSFSDFFKVLGKLE